MADISVSLAVQVMPMAMPQRRGCRRFFALLKSVDDNLTVRHLSSYDCLGERREVDRIA
jgi:hypothetical protein